jgi:hypothetical protein
VNRRNPSARVTPESTIDASDVLSVAFRIDAPALQPDGSAPRRQPGIYRFGFGDYRFSARNVGTKSEDLRKNKNGQNMQNHRENRMVLLPPGQLS